MAQAYATSADLLLLAPGLTAAPASVTAYLALAERFVDVATWGESASAGHALATLHLMAAGGIAGVPNSGAKIASKTIGRLSVSYQGDAAASDPDFGSTQWGAMFVALRSTIPVAGEVGRTEGALLLGMVSGPRYR